MEGLGAGVLRVEAAGEGMVIQKHSFLVFECVEGGRKQLQGGLNKNPHGSCRADRIQNQAVLEGSSEASSLILLLKARLTAETEPVSAGLIQGNLGNLQGWRSHNLLGQPVTPGRVSVVGGRRLNWWDQSQPRESSWHEGWKRLEKQYGCTGITKLARWVCLE